MFLKHKDIEIDSQNPFLNCKLDREKYAINLTKLIAGFDSGFVLAINNEWGAGKTTFVKMWQQKLKTDGYDTLYFNAWENDFESTPLVAILSELKEITSKENNQKFETLLRKGVTLTKSVIPQIIKSIADRYIKTDDISSIIEKLSEGAMDILKEEVDEYSEKKKGLTDFKNALSEFISNRGNDKPLIFIIDELDRCNPNYSVQLLENVKHFFSIEGIVFVLSIDKQQLGNAIQGYYGSDKINTESYLKRFIDLEFIIPTPKAISCCRYFVEYFEFNLFFKSPERVGISEFRGESENFTKFTSTIFEIENITLRELEKLFAHARIILTQFKPNQFVFPEILFFIAYLRDKHFNLYLKIVNSKLELQAFVSELETILLKFINEETRNLILNIEAILIQFYFNQLRNKIRLAPLIKMSQNNEQELTFNTSLGSESLLYAFEWLGRQRYEHMELNELTKKVDLTEQIVI